ncbi:MAG TPA: DUF2357 domain-containing protein [Clostridiaceae bacterium]|nr:DUF2357 domain-containing protein [Clostridiaceae bacterium]
MELPPIGCKEQELIYIRTDKFDLTIKGKPCHPYADTLINNRDAVSTFIVSCSEQFSIEVLESMNGQKSFISGVKYLNLNLIPLFYEQQNYQIIIENNGDFDLSFWHDNINIRERVNYVGKNKRTMTGLLNFGNEIGLSDMSVLVDGSVYLKITIEIFPSKLDYKTDYYNILKDISDEIYNLAFDFLRRTYLLSGIRDNVGSSLTEFFSIINIIFNKLKSAVEMVIKNPHHVLKCESYIAPFNKIKKVNISTITWLEKHPHNIVMHNGRYLPTKALTMKKYISYDTFENRFVKYIVKTIIKKLENVKIFYSKLDRVKDTQVFKTINDMYNNIKRYIELTFLKDVGDIYNLNSLSLVLNMAPGYKDIYKYYLMLIKGLSINGHIFKLSIKDLAVLYEYWCFIKLNSILKNKYKLVKQDLIKVDNTGLFVTLVKGRSTKITYQNPKNGEKFTISYNPSITQVPTVTQTPDNILTLEKHKSQIKYEYIFDAKYKINPALDGTDYKKAYGMPGPEEEDINTMHRYRDAIVYKSSQRSDFERTIFGAFVLFPYNKEKEYQSHRFYNSISEVNVGGLPFLPCATELVTNLLEELINDSHLSAFERNTLPKGSYEIINTINFEDRDVLVGSLRDKNQLKVVLEKRFYYTPYKNLKKSGLPFKYIALYQSERSFKNEAGIRYYGKIKHWEIVKRRDITEIPKSSDELYVKFYIENWESLPTYIKPKEYGVRSHIYTNKHLLLNSAYLPELCIKNKEEYRLYMELKRICDTVEIKAQDGSLDETSLDSFIFDNTHISIENDNIKVIKGEALRLFSLCDFQAKPRTIINQIRKFIEL